MTYHIICKWFHSEFIAPNDVSGTFGSFPWCTATSAASTTCTNFGSISAGRPTRGITGGWSGSGTSGVGAELLRWRWGPWALWWWVVLEELVEAPPDGWRSYPWKTTWNWSWVLEVWDIFWWKKQGGVCFGVCFGVFLVACSRNLGNTRGFTGQGAFKGMILESERWKYHLMMDFQDSTPKKSFWKKMEKQFFLPFKSICFFLNEGSFYCKQKFVNLFLFWFNWIQHNLNWNFEHPALFQTLSFGEIGTVRPQRREL